MSRYNKRNLRDMTILGGWLFADLVVALMVIFLAAQPAFPKPVPPTPTPTPLPSPSPTFTITPTPTPTPLPQTLDPHPLDFTVTVDPGQLSDPNTISYVKDQVMQQLNSSNDGGRKVGFVITLAGGISGVDHATNFNSILMSMSSFRNAVFKNYHNLDNPDSEFDLEIYFFL